MDIGIYNGYDIKSVVQYAEIILVSTPLERGGVNWIDDYPIFNVGIGKVNSAYEYGRFNSPTPTRFSYKFWFMWKSKK